jgi:hypothetical protein
MIPAPAIFDHWRVLFGHAKIDVIIIKDLTQRRHGNEVSDERKDVKSNFAFFASLREFILECS